METSEMREFFQRVVDHVNELTGTAAQVEGLRQQVDHLSTTVRSLEEQVYSLRQELSQAQADRDSANARYEALARDFDNERAVTSGLRETIVSTNSRVVDVEGQLRSETDSHTITKANLSDARVAAQEWEANYNKTKDDLKYMTDDRDHLVQRTNDLERENADLRAKLDRIANMFQGNVTQFPQQQAG